MNIQKAKKPLIGQKMNHKNFEVSKKLFTFVITKQKQKHDHKKHF